MTEGTQTARVGGTAHDPTVLVGKYTSAELEHALELSRARDVAAIPTERVEKARAKVAKQRAFLEAAEAELAEAEAALAAAEG